MLKLPEEFGLEIRHEMRGGNGDVEIYSFFDKADLPLHVRMAAKLVLKPGVSIGVHPHEGETEFFVFNAGTGLFDDNGEVKTVKAGDVASTGCGASHGIANNGDVPLEFTAFIVTEK